MGLKWTLFLVLGLSVAAWGFDLRRIGGPRGHLDLRNDKRVEEKSAENKEDHVEHPIPPSGPMSRIVLEEKDEEGKAHPTTVDLVMDVKDSVEKNSKEEAASSNENLAEKIEELKEAAANGKVEEVSGGPEDKSLESTTEKLESSHEGLKDAALDKAGSTQVTISTEKRDLKRDLKLGVVNAFHHSISGNRKDYFRNAVSMMSKEELDDLHDVLSRALKPLPDDDVKVEDVKEDFKQVVHELVEKQKAESSDMSEEKKDALIEIEHVLEEVKPEEEKEADKQVIKMKDWKKENIVGGIAQKTEDLTKDTELPKPNIGLPIPAPEEKTDLKKEEESMDKKDDKEIPAPTEEVKEVVIDTIPDVPDTPEKNEEEQKPKEEIPAEIKEKVKELVHKSGILGGILSKEEQEMLEGTKEEPSTEEEDSVIQPDEQKEEVIVVPLKASSEELEEEEKPSSMEEASADEPIEDKLILSPSKVLSCQTSSDESSSEDSKGVDEKSGGRGWGRGGSGRRNKRHNRQHNNRRRDGGGPGARRTRRAIYEDVGGSLAEELYDLPPPARLGRPMRTQFRQINSASPPDMIPPANVALGLPSITLVEPALDDILEDIKQGLRYVLQTENELTFPLHGTGTTGCGAVLDNLIEPGDRVLVMSNGYWGDLMANMSDRLGADTIRLSRALGTRYHIQEIEIALRNHKPHILAMVMGSSDTGVRQPMEGIGELTRKYGALLVVDVVSVAGMQSIRMDKMKIDAVFSGTSKGIGGAPGLAPVSLSPRAVAKLRNRKTPPRAYQTDLLVQAQLWNTDNRAYFQTLALNLLYSLREALAAIAVEGLENRFKRHADATRQLSSGMEAMGLKHFVPTPEDRLIGITTFLSPEGKDPYKIVDFMLRNSNVHISSGFGRTAGQLIRVATFASNANSNRVLNVLRALEWALHSPETNS